MYQYWSINCNKCIQQDVNNGKTVLILLSNAFSVYLKLFFKKYVNNKKYWEKSISTTDDILCAKTMLGAVVNLSSGKHLPILSEYYLLECC